MPIVDFVNNAYLHKYCEWCNITIQKEGESLSGKTSNESKAKYNAKAYDRINYVVKKGRKEEIQAAASAAGVSLNKYIDTAVSEKMAQDAATTLQRNAIKGSL